MEASSTPYVPPLRHPLARIRFEKHLSIEALADRSGVSDSTIFRIEARRVRPHRATVLALAVALDVDADLLEAVLREGE